MLKDIAKVAKKFGNVEEVKKALKSVQSSKCRLKKQKGRADYDKEMTKILKKEQMLKEVKQYFEPKKKFAIDLTNDDIQNLTYEETDKAIKAIQSKKCNSQYDEDQTEYLKACEIEKQLLEHKAETKAIPETTISKMTISNLVDHIEQLDSQIDKEHVLELLSKLTK